MIPGISFEFQAEPGPGMSIEAHSQREFFVADGNGRRRRTFPATAALSAVSGFATAAAVRLAGIGGVVARARSLDRDRDLHSLLPPAAASAPDAAVARRQRTGRRFAVVIVENDASGRESVAVAAEFLATGKIAGPLRGRAAARQLPRHQRRVRDRAGDLSPGRQLSDDRRRRDRLAGLAGADGARRRGHRRRRGRRAGAAEFRRRQEARPAPPSGVSSGL